MTTPSPQKDRFDEIANNFYNRINDGLLMTPFVKKLIIDEFKDTISALASENAGEIFMLRGVIETYEEKVEAKDKQIADLLNEIRKTQSERKTLLVQLAESKDALFYIHRFKLEKSPSHWDWGGIRATVDRALTLTDNEALKRYQAAEKVIEEALNFCNPRVCCHWNPETEAKEKEKCLHPLLEALVAYQKTEL